MTLESPDNHLSHLSLAVPTPLMPPAKCLFKFAKLTALRYGVILHGEGLFEFGKFRQRVESCRLTNNRKREFRSKFFLSNFIKPTI